jgi:transcriptional regulator with XRE-family HTH domain
MNTQTTYDPMKVGAKFRLFRKQCGWGQLDLALKIGYRNNSQLSEFENGKGMIPIDKINLAAKVLGIPPFLLISEKEYTEAQVELIVQFFKKMINGEDWPHYDSVKSLLKL